MGDEGGRGPDAAAAGVGEGEGEGEVWWFRVKCAGRGPVTVSTAPGARVADLCEALEGPTGVPVRGQTLIIKGTVLRPPGAALATVGARGGPRSSPTKVMMVAAKGVVAGPAATPRARDDPRPREGAASSSASAAAPQAPLRPLPVRKAAADTWRATGVVLLRDTGQQRLPAETLREVGDRARTLDASGNALTEVTGAELEGVPKLRRLELSRNALVALHLPALPALEGLQVLDLDGNLLRELPEAIGMLPRLRQLSARRNRLVALPSSLGALTESLEVVLVGDNQLEDLPASLADCPRLEELHAESTFVASIPEELAASPRLRVLNLDNTRIASVPPALLLGCTSLVTLSLHGAAISKATLQGTEGFEVYEARRRRKVDKQLEMGVQFDAGFDEGVDAERFIRNRSKDGGKGP